MEDLTVLPDDTIYHVIGFLNHNDLLSLCFANKENWEISKLARNERVWKSKFEELKNLYPISCLDKDERKRFDEEETIFGRYRVLKIASYLYSGVKCTIIGDGAVGKTCFIISYSKYSFPDDYVPTVYDECEVSVSYEKKIVKMKLVDTAGQEDYDRLRVLSYPGTDIFIICFSLVDPTSLENVETKWVPEIEEHCPKTPFLILGTKLDLREDSYRVMMGEMAYRDEKPVTYPQGEKVAKRVDALGYFECSSKTQKGVKIVLNFAMRHVMEERRKEVEKSKKKKKGKDSKCILM